jgi:hypothetical protein
MNTEGISAKIKASLEDERENGRLATQVRAVAASNGHAIKDGQVQEVVAFVETYVQAVPELMHEALQSVRGTVLERPLHDLLSLAQDYWREANDLIPEHHGLIGVLDDAYCTWKIVEHISDRCQREVGRPLFAHNLAAHNRLASALLGAQVVSQLEALIAQRIATQQDPLVALVQQLSSMAAWPAAMPVSMYINHPMYGTATVD